ILANRTGYHVDVSVDETEVGGVTVGDTADLTFNSLPDTTLKGTVTAIEPLGQVVQGLVKYTVRVDLATSDPRVLLGMTADVQITTHVDEGALAVPFDAVQLDDSGEYVNRIKADGTMERVDVKSGEVQGEQVVVTGALQPGDKVQLVTPKPANSGSPFGPG
nr:HlyD family efflux transporter periplasmic adaptor subunit [Chloroflexota bacterium]